VVRLSRASTVLKIEAALDLGDAIQLQRTLDDFLDATPEATDEFRHGDRHSKP